MENLTTLSLTHNEIAILPALHGLRHLTALYASENRISDFPVRLPSSLRVLDLSRNRIGMIPPDIENLSKYVKYKTKENFLLINIHCRLEFLNMWGNELTTLPPETCYLTALERYNKKIRVY